VKVVRTYDDELDGFYIGRTGTVIGRHVGGWPVLKVELDEGRTHAWFLPYELEKA
jgi:hypothetical protein